MTSPAIPGTGESSFREPDAADVARRLAAVEALRVLDRIGDPVLTALTRLAQSVTGASGAAVHIFDEHYQRRVAAAGVPLVDFPAQDSFCRVAVQTGTRIITADAVADGRFNYSSFVNDPVPVRFYAAVPLRVGGGVAVGTLCAFDTESHELTDEQVARLEDIAELVRTHLELVRLATDLGRAATLDPLTGAVNRVIFDDRVAQALARRRRRGTATVVAVIDIDAFKQINDAYGHQHGDAALQWLAERMQNGLRGEDTVGRLGGDEFGVVAEIAEPRETALEALFAHLKEAPEGFDPSFTVSVGTAVATDEDDVHSILHRADAAMYLAKRERKQDL